MPYNCNRTMRITSANNMLRASETTYDYTVDGFSNLQSETAIVAQKTTFTIPFTLTDLTFYEFGIKREVSCSIDTIVNLTPGVTSGGLPYWYSSTVNAHNDDTGAIDLFEKLYVFRSGSTLYYSYESTPVLSINIYVNSATASIGMPIAPYATIVHQSDIVSYVIDNSTKEAPTLNGSNQIVFTSGVADVARSASGVHSLDLGGGYRDVSGFQEIAYINAIVNRIKVRISKIA